MILNRKQAEYLTDANFGAGHTDEEIKAELISAGLLTDPLAKSSGIDGDAGDWTQTEGAGLTDDVATKATTGFVKPTLHVEGAS